MGTRQFFSAFGLTVIFTAGLVAQGGQIRPDMGPVNERQIEPQAINFAERWRPAGSSGLTKVIGTVIDIRQVPVANAVVQLRNLETGNVEQTSESSEEGEYEFEVDDPATYVVEMIMVDGAVVALSNAGSLARFETLNTVIQLPGRWDSTARAIVPTQNMTSFFGMSAQTTMTASTIEMAVDASIPPTNNGIPVSPIRP